jgi:hypothetical protein
VIAPYRRALEGHFDLDRPSWTERGLDKVTRRLRRSEHGR